MATPRAIRIVERSPRDFLLSVIQLCPPILCNPTLYTRRDSVLKVPQKEEVMVSSWEQLTTN
jgi:hypothetical protein